MFSGAIGSGTLSTSNPWPSSLTRIEISSGFTAAINMDVLPRVLMIAMNDGIYQSLAQCDFDVSFITTNASVIGDQLRGTFL